MTAGSTQEPQNIAVASTLHLVNQSCKRRKADEERCG